MLANALFHINERSTMVYFNEHNCSSRWSGFGIGCVFRGCGVPEPGGVGGESVLDKLTNPGQSCDSGLLTVVAMR